MTIHFVIALLLLCKAGPDHAVFDWNFPDEHIHDILTPGCGLDFYHKSRLVELIALKDRAFPAYRRLLNRAKLTDEVRGNILNVIALATKTDRRAFRGDAMKALKSPEYSMRKGGIRLIGELGNVRDSTLAFVLLSDEEEGIIEAALDCLVKIGDERELLAMEIWVEKLEKQHGIKSPWRSYLDRLKARLNPN
jgi:hypothetical protein